MNFKKKFLLLRSFLFAFFIITPPLFSYALANDEPDISIKAELSNAFITIGDPVIYTLTINRDPSVEILNVPPPPSSDILKIKEVDEFRYEEDGRIIQGRRIELTTFRLGEFILEPTALKYRQNEEEKTMITDRLFLTVKSVAEGEEKTDIRDVKGITGIPTDYKLLIILFILIAALILIIVSIQVYRKKKAEPEKPKGPVLTPKQEALYALNKLFDSDLLRQGKVKIYFLSLSEILRIFFEKQFQVLAVESTTSEIIQHLKDKQLPEPLVEKINEVLQASDLAKFAKWLPKQKDIYEINKSAKQIVEETEDETLNYGI